MPTEIPPPDDATRDALFPIARPAPAPGTFELGLVLGGTVSAGAYTAGALDCLLDMLEGWYDEGARHQVVVPIVTGASGGAICSGILGLLSRKRVPHIISSYAERVASDAPTGNPLWDVWVNLVDGNQFLAASDVADGPLISLLNGRLIDQISAHMVTFAQAAGPDSRPYFPAPYRMAVTLANLRGIPYVLNVPNFETWSGASYLAHDDFARFALPNGASPGVPVGQGGKRPDEFWVDPASMNLGGDYVGYETLMDYAVASAAFPAGLPARSLDRPAHHYAYRPYVRPKPDGAVVELPQPDWQEIQTGGDDYPFASVDGGTFNNDPMRLVHQALAGMAGENPRDPSKAYRALLMIDPLAAKPRKQDVPATDLVSVIKTLVGTATDGARYLTADMALIADPNVFSRFQLVPARGDLGKVGETALATDCVEAFGGFFCRAFRVHDFMLGQINMRNYLRTTMVLRGDNLLFNNPPVTGWSDADRVRWAVDDDGNRATINATTDRATYFLPIIPDVTYEGDGPLSVAADTAALPWPWKALDPETLRKPIGDRVNAVLTKLRQQELPGFAGWVLGGLFESGLASAVTSQIISTFSSSLADQGLWPKPV